VTVRNRLTQRNLDSDSKEAHGSTAGDALLASTLVIPTYGVPLVFAPPLGSISVVASSVVLVAVFTVITLRLSPRLFLYFWLTLAITQNFVVGIWHDDFHGDVPLLVTESKSVSLLVAIVVSVPAIWGYLSKHTWLRRMSLIFALIMAVHIRDLDAGALAYLRNFVSPLALALLVASITQSTSRQDRLHALRGLIYWTIGLLAAGTLSETLVGTSSWRSFLNASSSGALSSLSETTSFLGISFPRVGGTLIEPTNAGYVAAIAVILLIVMVVSARRQQSAVAILLCALSAALIVLVLAAAKSGLLMIAIAGIAWFLLSRGASPVFSLFVSWFVSFTFTFGYVGFSKGFASLPTAFTNPIAIVGGDSTTFHLAGFVYGIQYGIGHIFGRGIGVGGNFNRDPLEPWLVWLGTGSESAWGVLAYQTGILGLIAFLAFLLVVGQAWGASSAVIVAAWSASAMFAEAIFGPQVAGLALIGAAMLRQDIAVIPMVGVPNGTKISHRSARNLGL
jgi:hypothetical protein